MTLRVEGPPGGDPPTVATIDRFMRAHGIANLAEARRRSVEDIAWYWDAAAQFLSFRWSRPYEHVLDESAGPQNARWFVGGRLNLADNCVDRWSETAPAATAIVCESESGAVEEWSYARLREEVDRIARALIARGMGLGDVVASYQPSRPEAIATLLAIAKIGAVALPLFSGYAAEAVAARLALADAKLIVAAERTTRRGVEISMAEIAHDAVSRVPSVIGVVVVPLPREADATALASVPQDSEAPWLVAYTSGTTGLPKGAVHTHAGWLLQVGGDGAFALDAGPDLRLLWVSDPGWIMGPWTMTAALAHGGSLILLEGVVDHPSPERLWHAVGRFGITILALSPTLARLLMQYDDELVRLSDRSSLRALASTGEPWNEQAWRWFHDVVGDGRLQIVNVSGGTEVGGAFLTPYPGDPVRSQSLGGPGLGMALAVYDDNGRAVRGEVGELVCTRPWPSMTRGLYRDPPERFFEAYWSRFPGVWTHGDWASVDEDGCWYLHGRSDDTIKIAGKRLGPNDVESIVAAHPDVVEAAAIGVADAVTGQSLSVYAVLRAGAEPSEALRGEIAQLIADDLGRAFKPRAVFFVRALPKTRTAKVLRRVIRAVGSGQPTGDLSTLEDATAIDAIREAM